jgi:polysaccharide biosynthesis/export protein
MKFFFVILLSIITLHFAFCVENTEANLADTQTEENTENSEQEYLLKKGDVLDIEVMEHPEFSKEVRILPDGTIEYPILGNMKITEMSPKTLGEIIKLNLEPYVPIPIVTVYVQNIYGEKINILGYVRQPGSFQIYEPIDILDALAIAGGITNIRKVKYIRIIKQNGVAVNVKLSIFWFGGDLGYSVDTKLKLEAGDTLIVPPPADFNWAMLSAIVAVLNFGLSVFLLLQ